MNERKRFSDDHPLEIIRGLKLPDRAGVVRSFAQRAAWLSNRMEFEAKTNIRAAECSIFMHEIKAIAIAVEALDRVKQLELELAELRGAPAVNDEVSTTSFDEMFDAATETARAKLDEQSALRARR